MVNEPLSGERTIEQRTNSRVVNELLKGERTYPGNTQPCGGESLGEIALQDMYILTEHVACLTST